ncbi:MAG: FHA domain-containing protein [Chloroflexi bacterium]|nr:FHA domain-containing protein [Chloroflexota bacterium]
MSKNHVQISWVKPGDGQKVERIEALPVSIGRNEQENVIGLDSRFVSDQHARLEWQDDQIMIVDLDSKNGTVVNGRSIQTPTPLTPNSTFQIGPFAFSSEIVTANEATLTEWPVQTAPVARQREETALTFSPFTDHLSPELLTAAANKAGLPALFQRQIVPMADIHRLADVETTTYLTIGGGIGSFVWADHLVIGGVDPSQIRAIGFEPKPYSRYQRLCRNSQIPGHERLRSNSDSCPDNIWGWPGYGVREMWRNVKQGQLGDAFGIGWQLFNEPFVQTYTPKAQDVYDSMDQEAARIGWDNIWRQGRVRAIRKTDNGRYLIAYSHMNADALSQHRFIVCDYLHLAVGYPGVRFLPDLQAYRQETGDFWRVVNAYENHDHIYQALAQKGGVVLIRGRGIVASRIIQRLVEVREQHNVPIGILHLMRKPLSSGNQYGETQRDVNHHWELQPFNWPKAAWGGDLRGVIERADNDGRAQLIDIWGGTTTADRHDWQEMIERGLREGWYEIQFGTVQSVKPDASGRIATAIQGGSTVERNATLLADMIIDATGLESEIDKSPLLKELSHHYALPRNAQNRLQVSDSFEVEMMRNGNGRFYASGIITLGGPYAPVDSFLGLQYSAMRSVDHLTSQRAAGLRRLNGVRSLYQWLRWAKGAKP